MRSSSKSTILILSIVIVLVIAALLFYFMVFSKNAQYDKAISQADKFYTAQNYADAKGFYEDALEIKPDEIYAADQLEEIEIRLEELEKQQKYEDAILTADGFFEQRDYNRAREFYLLASEYNDIDSYPIDQIKRIEEILAEMEAEAARNSKKDFYYHIVIGSFVNGENAISQQKKWSAEGRKSFIIPREDFDMEAVTYDAYPDIHAAYNALNKVQEEITEDAWVIYFRGK